MKKSGSKEKDAGDSPSRLKDARIKELNGWRGETLARVRARHRTCRLAFGMMAAFIGCGSTCPSGASIPEAIYAIDVYLPMAYMASMLVSVVETDSYLSKARKIMSEAEMETVVLMISASAVAGDVIQGTGGLRKLRVPLQGRWPSAAAAEWFIGTTMRATQPFYYGFSQRMKPLICCPARKSYWLAPQKHLRGSSGA